MKRWLGMVGLLLMLAVAGLSGDAVRAQSELPELHIQKIVMDPSVPFEQGRLLDISIDIVNTGQRDSQGFAIEYAWRPLGSQGSWAVFFVDEVPGLRILDQSVTRTATLDTETVSVGTSDPIGEQTTFELRVMIDAQSVVAEQDEGNNQLTTVFTVLPNVALGKPDLRPRTLNFDPVSPVSVESRRVDGVDSNLITISSVVENIGDTDAGAFDVQISYCAIPISASRPSCLEDLTSLTTRLESQDSRALGGLAKDGSLAFSADLQYRNGNLLLLEAGTYLFQVTVDPAGAGFPAGEVDEQDEANNTLTGFLTIRGPELRPTRIDLGTSPVRVGDVVDIIATIANNGSSSAPAGYLVSFMLNGIPFGSASGPRIDPGSEGTVSVALNTNEFNLDANRAHTISVVVDANNRVFEPDETNNSLETALTLLPGVPSLAELHPKDLVLNPPSPIAHTVGGRMVVNSFIVNTGNAPALGFDIEFSYRVQGSQRWQAIPCVIPANSCRSQSLGRGQEVLAQGELLLDALSPGVSYEVRVEVDQTALVDELDENNNALTTTFSVRLSTQPDLVVTGLSFVPEDLSRVRAGQQVQVMATVSNFGELGVDRPFEVACELTDLVTFSTQPCPGQSRLSVNGLAIGEDRLVTFLVDTTTLNPGFYQVLITADSSQVVDELDENNNSFFSGTDLSSNALLVQGPDLAVFPVFSAPLPTSILQGERIDLSVQVNNDGLENAPRFVVRLIVTCGGTSIRSEERAFFGLGAGDSTLVSFSFGDSADPQDPIGVLPVGACQINVTADPDNLVPEFNEFNNSLFPDGFGLTLDVQPSFADLRPVALEYPVTPVSPGANVQLLARITNTGGSFFGAFTVRFSFCRFDPNRFSFCDDPVDFTQFPDSQTNTGETLNFGLVSVNGVPAESEIRVPTTFVTSGLQQGSYVLRVEVDLFDDVPEVDENDNVLVVQPPLVLGASSGTPSTSSGSGSNTGGGTVPPGTQSEADLLISEFNFPSITVGRGTVVNIKFTVFNQGIQNASAFNVRVFYLNNEDSAAGMMPIHQFFVHGLDAKQSIELSTPFNTGILDPARYKIIVIVDYSNQVQESFEGNNRQERWLRVV